MPQIRLDVVISLLDKWWACSAAVAAFNKVQHTKELEQKALKTYLNAFTQLLYFKKVCKKVQS